MRSLSDDSDVYQILSASDFCYLLTFESATDDLLPRLGHAGASCGGAGHEFHRIACCGHQPLGAGDGGRS